MSFLIDIEVSAGWNIAQKIMKIYKLIEILKLNYKNVAQIGGPLFDCERMSPPHVLRKCQKYSYKKITHPTKCIIYIKCFFLFIYLFY